MNARALAGLLLIAGVTLAACIAPGGGALPSPTLPPIVHLVGATDMALTAQEIQARGMSMAPPVEVRYTPTNTEVALRLLVQGRADIALASWLPDEPPAGFTAIPLGTDDIAIIVHPRVGVRALDSERVQRLFEGRYLSWSELGGEAVPVRLVSREQGSGTRAAFEALVMGEREVALTAVVMPSARDVVDYVARHEGAIGYVSARWEDSRVRVLRVDAMLPGDRGYPLRRTLYAVLPAHAPAWMRSLVSP